MKKLLKVAVVQMNSTGDKTANIKKALQFCAQAVSETAELVLLPEVFNVRSDGDPVQYSESLEGNSIMQMREFCSLNQIAIIAGSVCECVENNAKVRNTSVFIDKTGQIQSVYRKMHLFDCHFEDRSILESAKYLNGEHPVLAECEGIKIGMSICYDLRFPELYRQYSLDGARILSVPASFTTPTGKAHWETLLRARAIENLCFVLASNQIGIGAKRITTYGNSMIIDPWGTVIQKASEFEEEILIATLDFSKQDEYRKKLPALSHRRL